MKRHILKGIALLGVLLMAGCETTPVQDGAILGGALGAGAGAVIGHQSGRQGEGALIGAGVGALTGALVDDQVDKSRRNAVVYQAPSPANTTVRPVSTPQRGRYETRLVRGPSGEIYEERVWVSR